MKVFQEAGKRFTSETTIHGILELSRFRPVGKFFWGVALSGAIAFCSLQLQKLITDFSQDPQVTSITELGTIDPPLDIVLYSRGRLYERLSDWYPSTYDWQDLYEPEYPSGIPRIPEPFLNSILSGFTPNKTFYQSDEGLHENMAQLYMAVMKEILFPGDQNFGRCPKYYSKVQNIYANLVYAIDTYESDGLTNLRFNSSATANTTITNAVMALYASAGSVQKMHEQYHYFPLKIKAPLVNENGKELYVERIMTFLGLGFKFSSLGGVHADTKFVGDPARVKSVINIYPDCSHKGSVYKVGIGNTYNFPDHIDQEFLGTNDKKAKDACSFPMSVSLNVGLKKRTFHEKYCNPDMSTLCLTECMIEMARERGKCLRHLGVPALRQDIPLCVFESNECDPSIFSLCRAKCAKCKKYRPCTLYHPVNTIYDTGNSAGYNISIIINYGSESQHIHLAPKYNPSNFISSIGGIMGLGMGISLVSIMQILGILVRGIWDLNNGH